MLLLGLRCSGDEVILTDTVPCCTALDVGLEPPGRPGTPGRKERSVVRGSDVSVRCALDRRGCST